MRVDPLDDMVESGKWVVKGNGWETMRRQGMCPYLRKPPKERITALVPPWAKARYGKKALREGTRAVDKISAYVWSKLDGIHPGYRAALTEKVWAQIEDAIDNGREVTPADIDQFINQAIFELADELGTTVDAIKTSGMKKKRILEKRQKTRPKLVAIASQINWPGL